MVRDLAITPILINHHPLPGKTSWVKVFIYEPTEEEVIQTRGKMYALLSVSSKLEVDFSPVMQLILEELQTTYFQQTEGGILATLESALDGIHKKLLLMGQQDKRLSVGFDFNLLTAVSWGTILYIGRLGTLHAALYRHQKLEFIDDPDDTDLYLASGLVQADDRVILGTAELFDQVGKDTLARCLELESDQLAKDLEAKLQDPDHQNKQSAIVLDIAIKQIPSTEEQLDIQDSHRLQPSRWLAPVKKTVLVPLSIVNNLRRRIPPLPLILAILAAAALIGSIVWTRLYHPPKTTDNQAKQLEQRAGAELAQANSLANINPDRALDVLASAQQDIHSGLTAEPHNSQLLTLQTQAQTLQASLLHSAALSHLAPIATLPSSVIGQPKLSLYQGDIYLINTEKHQLLAVSPQGQTQTIATDTAALTNQSITVPAAQGLAVINHQQVWLLTNKTLTAAGSFDDNSPVAYTSYDQNLYSLDAQLGQVYRLPGQANSFGQSAPYLNQALSNRDMVDLAIDGSVYLLHQTGAVEQYLSGLKQPFSLERASLASHPQAIIATPDTNNIYISTTHSILVWNKKGQYQGQYHLPDNSSFDGFAVDEPNQTVYILSSHQLLKATLSALN